MTTLNIYVPKRLHSDIIGAQLEFEIQFLLVVGKGGATIKKLSTEYGVSIKIPNRDDPSSMIALLGAPDAVAKAKQEIETITGCKVLRLS